MRKLSLALAAVAALSITSPAQAIVTNYSFTGSATGTFSLDCLGDSCSLTAFDMLFGSTTFNTSNTGLDLLLGGSFFDPITGYRIGGTTSGVGGLAFGPAVPDDFLFSLLKPVTTPATVAFTGVLAGTTTTLNGQIVVTLATAGGVPEPSTWAMMLLGFAAIGFAMRRRNGAVPEIATAS